MRLKNEWFPAILTSSIYILSTFNFPTLSLVPNIDTNLTSSPPHCRKTYLLAFFRSHIALHSCFALMDFQFGKDAAGGLNPLGKFQRNKWVTNGLEFAGEDLEKHVKPKKSLAVPRSTFEDLPPQKIGDAEGVISWKGWLDGSSFMSER